MDPDLLLYVVSRRSFRSGGFNFFAPPLAGFGNYGGSEYQPETATDVEIGAKFKGTLGNAPVRLNVAAYNMWIDEYSALELRAVYSAALAGITVSWSSSHRCRCRNGLASSSPPKWLSLGGSLNATDARFTKNLGARPNPRGLRALSDTESGVAEGEATGERTVDGLLRGDLRLCTSSVSSTDNTI